MALGIPVEERQDPLEGGSESLSLVTRTANAESMGSMLDTPMATPHHHADDYSIGLEGSDDIRLSKD